MQYKKAIIELILVNIREFLREPGILFWSIGFPVLMAWVLGIAFSGEKQLAYKVAYINGDQNKNLQFEQIRSQAKQKGNEYLFEYKSGDGMPVSYTIIETDSTEANKLQQKNVISVILKEKDGKIEFIFDPNSPDARMIYLSLADLIENGLKGKESSFVSTITQKGSRYIDFLIPGLLALGLMNSCLWGISYNLIELRSKKLLRRMVATPMSKAQFIISQYISRYILAIIESSLLILFAWLYFDISIKGSLLLFFILFTVGYFGFSGIALFVGSRTSKLQIGQGLVNLVTLPMMILSGIFFSYHTFPDWALPVIKNLPLTMIADGFRGIFVEGFILADLYFQLLVLIITGTVLTALGIKIYKWQ